MTNLNRKLLWGIGFVLMLCLCWYFSDIVTYLLLAWVLSMLGRPLMTFFQKMRIGKLKIGPSTAALLTLLVFYMVLAGLLFMFVPTIVSQARNLADVDYQALGEKLRVPFAELDVQVHRLGLLENGVSLADKTQEVLSNWFKPTLLGDFLGMAGNVVVTLTAVSFILFFFLKDNNLFTDILHALVPNELEKKVLLAVDDSTEVLTRYFVGLIIQVACFSLSVSIILWILGVNNSLLVGAFGGIFNVIPYVGPIMGGVFGCFITLTSHVNADFAIIWPLLVKVIAAFAITQFIDNNFLGPLIFSKSVQAHPLEIFIVTLAAAKIGGVLGMVLGIPIYTVLRVIARVFFGRLKVVQRLTEHLDEEEK
jgi:predicted PurR-regulated permease PerM